VGSFKGFFVDFLVIGFLLGSFILIQLLSLESYVVDSKKGASILSINHIPLAKLPNINDFLSRIIVCLRIANDKLY
jgi:hypothetical protein